VIVLPIAERELRVASRRKATYRTRFGSVAVATTIFLAVVAVLQSNGTPSGVLGPQIFRIMAVVCFLYCLIGGARTTADCLSEEKREGTLGLLFLTDLTGRDVVFGKMVASSLNAFYGLLAILPFLGLPLLLGGITGNQFFRMVLVLINTLVFSLAVGVAVSAQSRNERKAIFATLCGAICVPFIPLLLVYSCTSDSNSFIAPYLAVGAGLFTPAFAVAALIMETLPMGSFLPGYVFWVSFAIILAISLLLITVTCRRLPQLWMEKISESGLDAWVTRLETRFWGSGARIRIRKKLLDINPFYWLAAREPQKPLYVWIFVVLLLVIWVFSYTQHQDVLFDFWPLVPTIVLVHGMLKLWIISEVTHRLVADVRSGSLELLLSSPLQADGIVAGQMLALRRFFTWPLVTLFAIELAGFSGHFSWKAILVVQILFAVDFATLHWLGMWLSLTSRSVNQVFAISTSLVMFLPWLIFLIASFFWSTFLEPQFGAAPFLAKVAVWAAISLAIDLFVGWRWARPNLLYHFRDAVLQRFAKTEPE
jgi:ABC-type transport system involved in cytochrome c biogenesis permease component